MASSWRMGLKYEVMGAAEAGMKGWRPLMFQVIMRIVCCWRGVLVSFGCDVLALKACDGNCSPVAEFSTGSRRRLIGGGLRLVSRFIDPTDCDWIVELPSDWLFI